MSRRSTSRGQTFTDETVAEIRILEVGVHGSHRGMQAVACCGFCDHARVGVPNRE
jgi:hypothetical protein